MPDLATAAEILKISDPLFYRLVARRPDVLKASREGSKPYRRAEVEAAARKLVFTAEVAAKTMESLRGVRKLLAGLGIVLAAGSGEGLLEMEGLERLGADLRPLELPDGGEPQELESRIESTVAAVVEPAGVGLLLLTGVLLLLLLLVLLAGVLLAGLVLFVRDRFLPLV